MNGPTDLPTDRVPLPAASEPKPATPDTPPPPAASEPAVAVPPAPKPRWVGEAVRDLLRVNRKKLLVLSTAGSVVAVGLALNALFTHTGRGPADAGREGASTEPPAVAAARPAEPPAPEVIRESVPPPSPDQPAGPGPVVVAPSLPEPAAVAANTGTSTGPVVDAPKLPEPTPAAAPPPFPALPELPVAAAPGVPPPAAGPVPEPAPDPTMLRALGLFLGPPALAEPIPAVPDPYSPDRLAQGRDIGSPSVPPPAAGTKPPASLQVIQAGASEPAPPAAGGAPAPGQSGSGGGVVVPPPVVLPGAGGEKATPPAPVSAPEPKPLTIPAAEPPKPASPEPSAPSVPKVSPPAVPAAGPPKAEPPSPFRAVAPDPPQTAPSPRPAPDPKGAKPAAGNLTLTKPAGASPDVRPAANLEPPRTDFDVDLYDPKAGDTYESISKLHYGDARYAAALRAYNKGLMLGRGVAVEVPPMYVLRKRYPQLIAPPRGAPAGPDWTPGKSDSYAVPRAGMTLKDVAAELYGDDREWSKLRDANPRLDPGAQLPAGTKLQLPPDARVKK
jgi:hypothetical protein